MILPYLASLRTSMVRSDGQLWSNTAEESMISARDFPNEQVPLECGNPDALELADLYSSVYAVLSSPNLLKAQHVLHQHQSPAL